MGLWTNLGQGVIDTMRQGMYNGTGLPDAPETGDPFYDDLYQANPYRNLTYHKSAWQSLLEGLGFRTSYDTWREQAEVNSAEYDARIMEMMKANQYNSPSAEAARMRQAGMNPDLLGTADVEPAAEQAPDPNGMEPNVSDDFNAFGETLTTIFSRAMVVWKDFKALDQMNAVIDAQNIDNARNMISTIDGIIEGAFTAEDLEDYDSYVSANNRLADSLADDEGLPFEQSLAYSYGFNKRQRNQFYQVARTRLKSMVTDKSAFENMKNRITAMNDAQGSKTSPFYSSSAAEDNSVNVLVKGVREAQREALKLTAEAQKYRARLEEEEQQTLSELGAGAIEARTSVTEMNQRKVVAQWNQTCARIKKDMLNELDNLAKRGDSFAKAVLYSWSLDDIARLNIGVNAGLNLSLGANFGMSLGKNISDVTSTIFKQ